MIKDNQNCAIKKPRLLNQGFFGFSVNLMM